MCRIPQNPHYTLAIATPSGACFNETWAGGLPGGLYSMPRFLLAHKLPLVASFYDFSNSPILIRASGGRDANHVLDR